MKRLVAALLAISLTVFAISAYADVNIPEADEEVSADVELSCMSAVLMDSSSGRILYSKGEDYFNSPASVTKVMTLLLVMEALERGEFSLSDEVMISEYASSMGGSQVFLKAGERMTVEELIKCTVIASANDAAVALAELVSGSEAAFVKRMNEKASELGLKKTSFENSTGLDEDTVEHYSCASDIAIMSRELIKHELITEYSSLWQDSMIQDNRDSGHCDRNLIRKHTSGVMPYIQLSRPRQGMLRKIRGKYNRRCIFLRSLPHTLFRDVKRRLLVLSTSRRRPQAIRFDRSRSAP